MKTIAIDFDGVIHKYSKGWQNGEIYDEPVTDVFKAIRELMDNGYSVFVFSTRKPNQIKKWLIDNCFESEYYEYGAIGEDPNERTVPKFGFEIEVISWWKVLFSKGYFWNKKNVLGITNIKLAAHAYIDDRALKFEGNWEQTIFQLEVFKTYQQ